MKAILLGSGDRHRDTPALVQRLRKQIDEYVDVVATDFDFDLDLTEFERDLVVVFGGDGSILRAARQMGQNQTPVLGVNLGKLGFLAAIQVDDFLPALKSVAAGDFSIIDHLMLRCRVFDGDRPIADILGLNEAAIMGGPPFSMQFIELYVDGEFATTYSCDGLIISTPIGSTAHNLSAGGPILRKNLQAIVVSPISPHTLTVRPIVDRADRMYEVVVAQPNDSTALVVDGQVVCQLTDQHRIKIERAEPVFQMVEIAGQGYYRTLRDKLGWGGNSLKRNEPN